MRTICLKKARQFHLTPSIVILLSSTPATTNSSWLSASLIIPDRAFEEKERRSRCLRAAVATPLTGRLALLWGEPTMAEMDGEQKILEVLAGADKSTRKIS